jgi:alpha-galactosidase
MRRSSDDRVVTLRAGNGFSLTARFGRAGAEVTLARGQEEWLASRHRSPLFRVRVADEDWCGPDLDDGTATIAVEMDAGRGWSQATIQAPVRGTALAGLLTIRGYECAPVLECHLELRNTGADTVRLAGVDTIALALRLGPRAAIRGFRSAWGQEFEPFKMAVDGRITIETGTGRSSNGYHPWLSYERADRSSSLVIAPMWSGNWICRAARLDQETVLATGGLSDREFWYDLEPGESFVAPGIALSLEDPGQRSALGAVGRRHWYPQRPEGRSLPVEWNHWFPYTDAEISAEIFLENVDVASDLGIEICTLDAGWFGYADRCTYWKEWRGDWHLINTARFPGGLGQLAERCRERNIDFGIWCEIEGLGSQATLAGKRPDFEAMRRGESLGYVCFGNPAARAWAAQVIGTLIETTGCRWIKLDFNVDPGYGCDRTDHGHGGGSGLYAHVTGYYAFLDDVRAHHPGVVLENCAGGGLRIDLEMLRHLHVTYLSDFDWLDHSLQIFWGATSMLHPTACLKFSYSEWGKSHPREDVPPSQRYNPRDLNVPPYETDTYLRTAMLHNFAVSQRLPELPYRVARRLRTHILAYKNVVRRFVQEGEFYRLTDQPLRSGGNQTVAFQFSLPQEDRHLLFVFRIDGKSDDQTVRPLGLSSAQSYSLSDPIDAHLRNGEECSAADLCERGIDVSGLRQRESMVLLLEPVHPTK